MTSKYKEAQVLIKERRFDEAIEAYNQAIETEKEGVSLYSGRSSAFLAIGNYEKALEDAKKCLEIRKHDPRGHGCRAAVYHAQKKYAKAIQAYNEGLKYKKDSDSLLRGLAASKKAKLDAEMSAASQAAQKTQLTGRASIRLMNRARNARTLSSYVKQKKKELEMTLVNIRSQLDLIEELAAMSDESKMDFIFCSIDVDGNGMIDAEELAEAMRRKSQDMLISFSLEHAMALVSKFDKEGQAKLGPADFRVCVNAMLAELKIDLLEFSQFLVLQTMGQGSSEQDSSNITSSTRKLMSGETKEEPLVTCNAPQAMEICEIEPSETLETLMGGGESGEPKESIQALNGSRRRSTAISRRPNRRLSAAVKPRRQSNGVPSRVESHDSSSGNLFADFAEDDPFGIGGPNSGPSILEHPRVRALFQLFVHNSTGEVYFKDLAPRLYHITSDMDATVKAAMKNLLMMEKGDTRTLTYEKFGRLLMAVASASRADFSEIADDLMISLLKEESIPDRVSAELLPGRAMYKEVRAMEKEKPRTAAIIKQLSARQLSVRSLPTRQHDPLSFHSASEMTTTISSEEIAGNVHEKVVSAKEKGGTSYLKQLAVQKLSLSSSQHSTNQQAVQKVSLSSSQHSNTSLSERQASVRSMSETSASTEEVALNAVIYARLQQLFDWWDMDHNEHITFAEMQSGLQTFQRAAGIEGDIEQHARLLLLFDDSGEESLDRHEFVRAMFHYALWFMVDIHELIDFMSVAALLGTEDSQCFRQAYGESFKHARTDNLKDSFVLIGEA